MNPAPAHWRLTGDLCPCYDGKNERKRGVFVKKLWELYGAFFRVGAITFGGGYAMLPIMQREIVERKKWATEEELADYYAIGQCTPGAIAVNVATFIGRKYAGIAGGVVATLGVVSPSVVIICVIAALIHNFAEISWVQDAMGGIRVCVCVFIFNAVVRLIKSAVTDKVTLGLYLVLFGAAVFFDFSPIYSVVLAGILGVVFTKLGVRGK